MSNVLNNSVQGDLSVSRNTTVGGDLKANGGATFEHSVRVKGGMDAEYIKAKTAKGDLAVEKNLSVGGKLTSNGNLEQNGDTELNGNVRVKGTLYAENIKSAFKGLFSTLDALRKAYPSPDDGSFALVGSSLPADVYKANNNNWSATGEQGGGSMELELGDYLQAEAITDVTTIL